MATSESLYFWRKNSLRSRSMGIVILIAVTLVLLSLGGGGAYYYFVYKPEQERLANVEKQRVARQQKINALQHFYEDSLSGGSIDDFSKLLIQIYQANKKAIISGFFPQTISCDSSNCSLSYKLSERRIFNVTDIDFWGEKYSANFSKDTLDFSQIPSKLNQHPWLTMWKGKQPVALPTCTDLLSYISTWNSMVSEDLQLQLSTLPSSPVVGDEVNLKNAANSFGLLFSKWTLKISHQNPMPNLLIMLQKQQFAESFIIKSVVFDDKSTLVTGGLACKKGN